MSRSGGGLAAGAGVLCALLLPLSLPGAAVASPLSPRTNDAPGGEAASYKPADGAVPVTGTESSADGPELERAKIYSDTIGPGQKKYYRVRLDDTSNAFISTVVAPPPGTKSGILDGIQISLTSDNGTPCSSNPSVYFGGDTTRPLAGYASRRIKGDSSQCQEAGDYLYTVSWAGSQTTGTAKWPIELTYMAEPGLEPGADDPEAPTGWSSKAPSPSSGTPQKVSGGTGFNDAAAIGDGTWRDDLEPGDSRFYRVPVAWGQQLFLRAQLANTTSDSSVFAVNGLRLALYNTARGLVADKSTGYRGAPAGTDLGTAPAAYANRFATGAEAESAMRFQGWYYVQVTLDPKVSGSVPMTLNVGLQGDAQPGPPYDGDAAAAGFGLDGAGPGAGGADPTMRTIGFAGIGAGTVLILGLGAWQLVSRRRRPAEDGDAGTGAAYSR
uniref:Peptidase n=1 Tax=Streptomyces sp. NBC_01401 TaxID=2903854 RepID=A0AAU3GRC0_9ACTN